MLKGFTPALPLCIIDPGRSSPAPPLSILISNCCCSSGLRASPSPAYNNWNMRGISLASALITSP